MSARSDRVRTLAPQRFDAVCPKATYAAQQNLLMMFQCRLSCVWAGSAAIASFGASSVHRQQDDMQRHNRDQVESTTDSAEVARGLLAARRHAAGTSEAAQWGRLV